MNKSIENPFQSIFNEFEDAIMFFDTDSKIRFFNKVANDRLYTIIKRPLEIGMDMKEYMPKTLSDAFYNDFLKCLNGEKVKFERIVQFSQNKSILVQVSMQPVYDENEQIMGVTSYSTEITERKYVEESLLKSEANLRAILENTDTAFALLDLNSNIISFNSLANKLSFDETRE